MNIGFAVCRFGRGGGGGVVQVVEDSDKPLVSYTDGGAAAKGIGRAWA